MDIVSVRPSPNLALAKAENDVQVDRAARAVQDLLEQVRGEIVKVQQRIEEDAYRVDLERYRYLSIRLEGFRTLERRLGNAWGEVLGVFGDDDKAPS